MPNRLSSARSPYLQKAAGQPVDWHEWGDEAFAKAREKDMPILLSVGGVWCHWCHVMAHESFEDPDMAALINEHFVSIKVDRDERPDIDRRYQDAVMRITGSAGWPLTAFLTPEGKVFYGGTYFPPEDKWGRPGLRTVIRKLTDLYREDRKKLEEVSDELYQHSLYTAAADLRDELDPELIERGAASLLGSVDLSHGGLGSAPKFHHSSAFEFLIDRYYFKRDEGIGTAITRTLDAMARGGIYDHLLGGFFRYSTDEKWVVPHFEKMLHDNAELLKLYAVAFSVFGNDRYREVADGIVAYYRRYGVSEEGGFYASQDADVGVLDEGGYYTFSLDEVGKLLTPEELEVAVQHFDIGATGEMHHDSSRNVLFVDREVPEIALLLHIPRETVLARIASARSKLLAFREAQRQCPYIDKTIYANWNGLMIEALSVASVLLGDAGYRELAERAARRIMREYLSGTELLHRDGVPGFSEDYLFFAKGLIALGQASGDAAYVDTARTLVDQAIARFWDKDNGGFFDAESRGEGYLKIGVKNIQDTPVQSANGTAALVLLQLAALTGETGYVDYADKTLRAFAGLAREYPALSPSYLTGLHAFTRGIYKVETGIYAEQALAGYRPFKLVIRKDVEGVVICEKETCQRFAKWPPVE